MDTVYVSIGLLLFFWRCDSFNITDPEVLIVSADTKVGGSRINFIAGRPKSWWLTGAETIRYLDHVDSTTHYGTMAYHARKRLLFVANKEQADILQISLSDSDTLSRSHATITKNVGGLTLDWMTDTLFWTDRDYRWIASALISSLQTKTKIREDIDYLHGITVHPFLKYLFWIEGGPSPKIYRSDLNGQSVRAIIDTKLSLPIGITMDFTQDKIYWTDGGNVGSASLDGSNFDVVISQSTANFNDIALSEGLILMNDVNIDHFWIMEPGVDRKRFATSTMARPRGIVMMSEKNQPLTYVKPVTTTTSTTFSPSTTVKTSESMSTEASEASEGPDITIIIAAVVVAVVIIVVFIVVLTVICIKRKNAQKSTGRGRNNIMTTPCNDYLHTPGYIASQSQAPAGAMAPEKGTDAGYERLGAQYNRGSEVYQSIPDVALVDLPLMPPPPVPQSTHIPMQDYERHGNSDYVGYTAASPSGNPT